MTQTSALKQGQEKRLMGIVCVMSRIQTLPSLHFPLSLSHSISLSRSPSLSLFLPSLSPSSTPPLYLSHVLSLFIFLKSVFFSCPSLSPHPSHSPSLSFFLFLTISLSLSPPLSHSLSLSL